MSLQARHIDLLKNSLLDEPYLENEARPLYVFAMLATRQKVDADVVRDIGRKSQWVFQECALRQGSVA